MDKSAEEIYLDNTYSTSQLNYGYKNKFNPIDDIEFEKNAKMYCKLKRWYKKNGMPKTKESKSDSGKTKSKTTRIIKQIDENLELRDL